LHARWRRFIFSPHENPNDCAGDFRRVVIAVVFLPAIDEGLFMIPELTERLKTDRYLDEHGNVVFTERFLARRNICCGFGCRHCPYSPRHQTGNTVIAAEIRRCIKTHSDAVKPPMVQP
jgi:hypothetical protein